MANLCVPYLAKGLAPENLVPLVNRSVYPEAEFPVGQWDYVFFYQENFAAATAGFEANVGNTIETVFRSGKPENKGQPSPSAFVRRNGGYGGWLRDVPPDPAVLTEEDLSKYVSALERNGFFGPNSWYMNFDRNVAYAAQAKNGGKLTLPVLFLHADYDHTCETVSSWLAEPMRQDCADLTEVIVPSGHWMAHEQPVGLNAALAKWLATRVAGAWDAAR